MIREHRGEVRVSVGDLTWTMPVVMHVQVDPHAGHRWGGRRLRRARLLRIRRNKGRRGWALLMAALERARAEHVAMVIAEALAIGRPDLAARWEAMP